MFHSIIFHITTKQQWEKFANEIFYFPDAYQQEGFIHASTIKQLEATAHRYYAAENEIILLHIDANAIKENIKYEWANSVQDYFPHIYSAIQKENILEVQSIIKVANKFNINIDREIEIRD
ncbi:MAG: hypothetical protein RL708_41 [Bacteroidota bacterium]|jgi:uncharacterized protein (DUF952 family)